MLRRIYEALIGKPACWKCSADATHWIDAVGCCDEHVKEFFPPVVPEEFMIPMEIEEYHEKVSLICH